MKLYTAILVPLVVLALVALGGYFVLPSFDSPQSQLYREADEKVELAERILNSYNPDGPRAADLLAAPTTRPDDIDSGKWQTFWDLDENTPFASLKSRLDQQEQKLRQAAQRVGELGGGESANPGTVPPAEASEALKNELRAGLEQLDAAIAAVSEAISLEKGEGEEQVRGSSHPVATRMHALLLFYKADLLRSQAALERARADLERSRFQRTVDACRLLDRQLAVENVLLAGGTAPGMTAPAAQPAEPPAEPAAAQPTGQANPSVLDVNAKAAPGGEPGARKGWIFSNLAAKVIKRAPEPEAPRPQPVPAPPSRPEPKPEAQVVQSRPETPAGPTEALPSLQQRIAALETQRAEVKALIAATEQRIAEADKQVQATEARIAESRKAAAAAEVKMMEAEQKGIPGSDPEQVKAFVEGYRELSQAQRRQSREAVTLERGALRNARSAEDDPEQIMNSPLVPVEQGQPIRPERGLAAVKFDLAEAQTTLKTSQGVLAEIERQIVSLTGRQKAVQARVAGLRQQRQKILADASVYTTAAMVMEKNAEELEKQAVEIATGAGQQAVQQAQAAAGEYQRGLATFVRRENPTEAPDRKLTDMAGDQFLSAAVAALQGDLSFLAARVLAQQATGLAAHERMLSTMAELGMAAGPDAKRLPEGTAADSIPPGAVKADEAAKLVKQDLEEAAKKGREAIEQYTKAATEFKELWSVHVSIAAVHNMLADLPRVEGDTEDHLALARGIYSRAPQGRDKRAEAVLYRQIAESLVPPPKEGQ